MSSSLIIGCQRERGDALNLIMDVNVHEQLCARSMIWQHNRQKIRKLLLRMNQKTFHPASQSVRGNGVTPTRDDPSNNSVPHSIALLLRHERQDVLVHQPVA